MSRWVGKVAVVTGASAGIGAAIVEKLVQEGLIVVGFARRKERVEELAKKLQKAKGKLYAVKVDITKEDEIIEGFNWVKKNVGPVHILINNAGVAKNNSLIDGDSQKWRDVLDTNVFGLCVATREAIKDMKLNNVEGHIIHINSIAGHKVVNFPKLNVYGGSKYAVTALAETLRNELLHENLKIKVTSVSPGLVKTEIFETADSIEKAAIEGRPALTSEDVADAVWYALATPPHVEIPELTIKPLGETF
ncbi:farnesol dehydrogenase [Agrilus planipennis]|uniref:Farnesol dehydrogenase n=1 Tax=Agrilus planipennis TaxID=224129 RepID=A0A7F5RNS0_AGRPL|nr:farnesol dehydrogenase [Agrilus planipennis]